jgi:type I restriction enzyme, S subunit
MQESHLADLLSFTRDGEWGNGEASEGYSPALVIRGTDFERVRAGNLNTLPLRYIRSDILARKAIAACDTLIETAGGTKDQPTGRTVFIPSSVIAATNLPLICASFARFLRPDSNLVDPRFLFWKLQDEYHSRRMMPYHVQHTGVARFQYTQFAENYPFSLPNLPIQRAIASTLGALDDKIELNRRMNETLEAMARAIFKDWFVDFGPTRAKAEGCAPYLSDDLWSLFPNRLDEDGKPEGWTTKPLSEFFSIIGGGTPKTSVEDYWNGDIPWFSVVDTPPRGNLFVFDTEKSITERGLNESSAYLVPAGTTIISARGTVGNLAIAARDMTFNQSCYALRAKDGAGDSFVFLAAQQMVTKLQAMAHGSVFSTITRSTFDAITFECPSDKVLITFESVAKPIFAKIKANVDESRTLAQTRDLLLPKLMSGEIRIRDAETFVENAL